MKAKKLLPIALLAAMTLVACGGGGSGGSEASSQTSETSETSQASEQSQSESSGQASQSESESSPESSSQAVQYGASVKNKDAFEGIRVGDHVDLDIELTPEANVAMEIAQGNLIIEADKAGIVTITGAGVSAVGAGEVTVSVYYMDFDTAADQLTFTVEEKLTPKIKYGTVHEGTLEDPFDNADAWTVGLWAKDNGTTPETDLYIKGKVQRFYYAPGSRADGNVAFYLEKGENDPGQFEVFKLYKDDGKGGSIALTDDDIWASTTENPCEVTVHGPITYYASGNQPETSYAWYDKAEGTKPQPPVEYESDVAGALTIGKALEDGDQTYDYYNVTGYVVRKSGTNYFMADTQTVEESVDNKDLLELYNISSADEQAKLLQGAKVTVKIKVKNYHGQIENGNTPVITVIEEGQPWATPEPAVTKKTLAEFIALDATQNGKKAYEVTAELKSFKNGSETNDQYGNLVLTDGTNDLVIYGCSATTTALAWDGSGSYAFTNPKDFQTNEVTSAIKIGDTLKMKLIRADYKETIQGTGLVLEVNPSGGDVEPEVVVKTLAEFIALDAADNGKHAYKVTAEVKSFKNGATVNDQYGNLVLTDGENDLVIYGCSATEEALVWGEEKYTFTNPKDFQTNATTAAIAIGDTVEMKLIRADYKGAVQGTGIVLSVTPGQGGGGDVVPEPDVVAKTVEEFIALDAEDNGKHAYTVSAEVKSFKNGATTNDQYGNLVLTDGTNDLVIYGCSATTTALVWDGASTYVFTNPKDFQTNATTAAIAIGDTVEMKLIRADYKGAVQGTGLVLSVTPGQGGGGDTETVLAQQDFTGKSLGDWTSATGAKLDFYSSTGIKLNVEGLGVASPVFEATGKVKVEFAIGAFNANTKSAGSAEHVFAIYALNASGETVATGYVDDVKAANEVTLEGTGIVSVKIVYERFFAIDGVCQNLGLAHAKVAVAE